MWDTSCVDWEYRIRNGLSLIPDLPLFEEEAEFGLELFKQMRIPNVEGKPKMAVAAGPWFLDIVSVFFGSINPNTNERIIREFFTLVPKKNGKSTYSAALMLTALLMNKRPGAEFVIVAPTKEIASISFNQAAGMVKASRELDDRFHIVWNQKLISDKGTQTKGTTLKVKTFDEDIVTGSIPSGILIDEYHLLGAYSNAMNVIGQLRGGMLPNPEAFIFSISTQSDTDPTGAFKVALDEARQVRDGKLVLPLLPILYEFPRDIAEDRTKWEDTRNWPMVTPNLGRPFTVERLEEDWTRAKNVGSAEIIRWASQHLNIEVGLGIQSGAWAGVEFWESAVDETITVKEIIRRCDVVVVGIDGGGLDDLLGLAVLGREKETGHWLLWNHAWAHEIVKVRRKEIAPKLEDLARLKQLTFVKLPGDDVYEVADIVMEIEAAGLLASEGAIGVDTFGVTDIVKELTINRKIAQERIVGVPQGWKLSGAIKTAERNLAGGTLLHAGLDLMNFAVGNARVEPRGNAISITKQASGTAKIDPLMATFNTIVLMGENPEARKAPEFQLFMVA